LRKLAISGWALSNTLALEPYTKPDTEN
jgi:hypothetical protein